MAFTQQIGRISEQIEELLGLHVKADRRIYIGSTNIIHMKTKHPDAYAKYGQKIPQILSEPDYVRVNERDGSIEYVKEYLVNDEFVKIAVRLSVGDKYYARTLYTLNPKRVNNFIQNGDLKKVSP